ncbi:diguanylate cyclase [Ningiella sp. W23]|uniref:GGDEF domain-containing protein n=1 Tax=Ningiella sp. W23 TaxID=3023715 RepID=UPI003757E82A
MMRSTAKKLAFISCIALVLAALLPLHNAYSQTPDSERISVADLLERAYSLRSSKPHQSTEILTQINRDTLSGAQQDKYDIIQAYLIFMNGDIKGSINAFELLAENGNTQAERFNAYASLVSLYSGTQNWSAGFKTLDYLSENIAQIDSLEAEEQAHLAVINFYSQIDEADTLLEYIPPLLNVRYSLRFECLANMQLLGALIDIDASQLQLQAFSEAKARCDLAGEGFAALNIENQLATYYFKQGNPDRTLDILNANLDAITSSRYKPLIDESYMLLSQAYFEQGDFELASEFASLIVENKQEVSLLSVADTVGYKVLQKIAEKRQNFEQALEYHKKYSDAKSRNITSDNAKMLAIQKARQDSEQKSNQIALLDAENSLLRTQAQLDQEAANNRLLVIVTMTMLLLFICFWIYKKRSNYLKFMEISRKDSLTGIANRHFFTSSAHESAQKCSSENIPMSLVLFDLDDFKQINDTHGHAVGDDALKKAVDASKLGCRTNDLIGRLGGEEFGIILEGCAMDKALLIAQACRKEIDRTNASSEQDYTLTASFGVASSEGCGYSFDKLFDAADKALYQAKLKGKNGVEHQR